MLFVCVSIILCWWWILLLIIVASRRRMTRGDGISIRGRLIGMCV